jgi:hypothetical protein
MSAIRDRSDELFKRRMALAIADRDISLECCFA